jgi:hypothetical protein
MRPAGTLARGGGEVVGDIQAEGELGGPVLVAAGGQQLGGAEDEQGGGDVAELEGRHPDHEPAEASGQHRSDAQPQRSPLALLGAGSVADGVDDGQGGEQAGDDGQGDGGAGADQADQAEGEQRAGDGAEVVHGPLEPVGPAVDAGRDDVGQQGVARRDPQAPGGPGASPQDADLPHGGGHPDEAGEDGGGGVAAHGLGAAALGVVGDGPPGEAGGAGQPVGEAFDEAEGGGGGAQGGGEQVGQEGGGDLVADVGKEAGRADARHPWPQPALARLGGLSHGEDSLVAARRANDVARQL